MIPDTFDTLSMRNWFPGHMFKAGKQMQEAISLVDLAVELVDARAPLLTRNPELLRRIADKPHIVLANKSDLAAPSISRQWMRWFSGNGELVQFIDSRNRAQIRHLPQDFKRIVAEQRTKRGATRPLLRPVRIMISGVPNVGKSTLVNHLLDRNKAQVGPKPGVTRANQWLALMDGVDLLDTPGLLWPNIASVKQALMLALLGIFNDALVPPAILAEYLAWQLEQLAVKVDWSAYGLAAPPDSGAALLDAYARKRSFLLKGGEPDLDRAATTFIKDFRDGRLGRITLQIPESSPSDNSTPSL